MKIYTLNVNGFRGLKKPCDNSVDDNEIENNLKEFVALIKKINLSEDDIIITQEIPHKNRNTSQQPWAWKDNKFYDGFNKLFSEYKIIKPNHLINSYQCTVAICHNSSSWKCIAKEKVNYTPNFDYGNRMVELEYDKKFSLVGVHMQPVNEMWNMIISSEKKDKHSFIVGDFNAYEYRGTMRDKPSKLREQGFISLIPSNTITDSVDKSSIDNIYVDSEQRFDRGISIKVENPNGFITDHALCCVEFSLK